MARKTSIIYMSVIPECYRNLKRFCDTKGLKYNTISKKKLPIEINGYMLHRVKNN